MTTFNYAGVNAEQVSMMKAKLIATGARVETVSISNGTVRFSISLSGISAGAEHSGDTLTVAIVEKKGLAKLVSDLAIDQKIRQTLGR